MARFRPFLIRLLAAVLLLQSGVMGAHGLRGMSAGEGLLVELCSTEGMRTIRLDAHGEPAPEPEGGGGFCPLCLGPSGVTLPLPPRLATRAWFGFAITWQAAGMDHPGPAARAPPYATRAPPITA